MQPLPKHHSVIANLLGEEMSLAALLFFAFPLCCTVAAVAAGTLATRIPAASMIEMGNSTKNALPFAEFESRGR
jgi:hypothetical protein